MTKRAHHLIPALAAALLAACGGGDPATDAGAQRTVLGGQARTAADTIATVPDTASATDTAAANTTDTTNATSTANAAAGADAAVPAAAAQVVTTATGRTIAGGAPLAAAAPAIVLAPVPNEAGASLTVGAVGGVDSANPFFKPFGNGRSCASCHQPDNGWSIGPEQLNARFTASNGADPVFSLVDGAVSPLAAVATLDQKRIAYSLLLTKGLIRVGLPMPAGAEFTLVKADDPYNYASAGELSLFRRPLPTTNLRFASGVMWDGRESPVSTAGAYCLKDVRPAQCYASVDASLLHQSNSAVRGHAQAARDLTAAEQRAIVDFEKTLFTAQLSATAAGNLTEAGALGGPLRLSAVPYYFGINDLVSGDYQTGAPFNRDVMALFGAWRNLDRPVPPAPAAPGRPAAAPVAPSAQNLARAAIARGEQIFNTRPFNIVGVAGFNDELRLPLQRGSCASCHDTPAVGGHSVQRLFDTGVSAAALRTRDMPLYTLSNSATGETVATTDPGAAMLSGKWKDIGRMKVPGLRGLESRSPYFHNGSARVIEDVVKFYDTRFKIGFTPQEAADLAAFLRAL